MPAWPAMLLTMMTMDKISETELGKLKRINGYRSQKRNLGLQVACVFLSARSRWKTSIQTLKRLERPKHRGAKEAKGHALFSPSIRHNWACVFAALQTSEFLEQEKLRDKQSTELFQRLVPLEDETVNFNQEEWPCWTLFRELYTSGRAQLTWGSETSFTEDFFPSLYKIWHSNQKCVTPCFGLSWTTSCSGAPPTVGWTPFTTTHQSRKCSTDLPAGQSYGGIFSKSKFPNSRMQEVESLSYKQVMKIQTM
ncbi:uncharacterized protein LOC127670320 isoform X2 [Apodemus sylvaticus]|uniref:uncharacterized protein LOC127670320 isoform X2 n=1 Tax=Apodemus sylvaticus TaxID=10129 RepID=UPI00224242D7|nr:uncharacterized protein LOC127670320 isoform X2 [Apodemus sylvaticus]